MQRMVDEFCEDLDFLSQPLIDGEPPSDLHVEYLEGFYQEEVDAHGNPFLSKQKRPQVPRDRIRAAIARTHEAFLNPSDAQEMMRPIDKANSGFIHGASPHTMEMYDGARFRVSSMLGTTRIDEATRSLRDYFAALSTLPAPSRALSGTEKWSRRSSAFVPTSSASREGLQVVKHPS